MAREHCRGEQTAGAVFNRISHEVDGAVGEFEAWRQESDDPSVGERSVSNGLMINWVSVELDRGEFTATHIYFASELGRRSLLTVTDLQEKRGPKQRLSVAAYDGTEKRKGDSRYELKRLPGLGIIVCELDGEGKSEIEPETTVGELGEVDKKRLESVAQAVTDGVETIDRVRSGEDIAQMGWRI